MNFKKALENEAKDFENYLRD